MVSDQLLHSTLEKVFGFSRFRENQLTIVKSILASRDTFTVMPTGGGKSLCYQLPAVLLDGCCVVVSPLISLMKDQVDAALANGIRACTLNSTQSDSDRSAVYRALDNNEVDLLYISPERLALDSFLTTLHSIKISFFAIDEAHCISQWGHEFRPDYLCLTKLRTLFNNIPITAFTATATPSVQSDIVKLLHLADPFIVRASFNRPNLHYSVSSRTNADQQILSYVNDHKNSAGIIYRLTRQSVDQTAALLNDNGIKALPYHAGLDDQIRARNQEQFRRDEVPVIVATVAFGMGIDKPNIRYVLHGDLPRSIEHYYQETGRAGRDGEPSECHLLFSRGDIPRLKHFLNEIENNIERSRQYEALEKIVDYASQPICRRESLLAHFGESSVQCDNCDICKGTFETVDITIDAQKVISAIARTNQRFGAGHIIEVITGANTKEIREQKHDQLKTWGVGKDKPRTYWRQVIDELLNNNLLVRSDGAYPTLAITEDGWSVVKQEKAVTTKREKTVQQPSSGNTNVTLPSLNQELYVILCQLRTSIAREKNLPAYIIFHDRSLREMAAVLPRTPQALSKVFGCGERKVKEYGEEFLKIIHEFCDSHQSITPFELPKESGSPSQSRTSIKNRTITPTVELTRQLLFDSKMSIPEAAAQRNLAMSTIAEHLERIILSGYAVQVERFIDDHKRTLCEKLIGEYGMEALRPIVENGNGEIGYEDARIMRAHLQMNMFK